MPKVVAPFEPLDSRLLTWVSNSQLLHENPMLSSTLSQAFPYLLLVDTALEAVTWTHEDLAYSNFLICVGYALVVTNWSWVGHLLLPLMITLAFSAMVFHTSSVVYDSAYNEKPTVDEVLYVLNNITERCIYLFNTLSVTKKRINKARLIAGALIFTPLHYALVKYLLGTQLYILLLGLVALTFNAPFAYATRRLLWRSVYVKLAFGLLIDVELITDERMEQKSVLSTGGSGSSTTFVVVDDKSLPGKKIVRYDILENERRWLVLGWSKNVGDRPPFSYKVNPNTACSPPEEFQLPSDADDIHKYHFEWLDKKWKGSNWVYMDSHWKLPGNTDGFNKNTRERIWSRRAYLITK